MITDASGGQARSRAAIDGHPFSNLVHRRPPRLLSLAYVITLLSTVAVAQPPAASDSAPTISESTPHDCRQPMARHDHLAEKGMTRPMSGPCAGKPSASAAKA
ncbi:hypothetical protein A8M77_21550 [Variovorax sp. JS1663]|nr:hypothetical protein A8M77_21550 [Variovorax sp. JS1663]